MIVVILAMVTVALVASLILAFVAPFKDPGYRYGVPFKYARVSRPVWQKSDRFAGCCLFLSCIFLAVPPFIWGWGKAVQTFLLLVWSAALLPLLALTVYAYSLLQFLKEDKDD